MSIFARLRQQESEGNLIGVAVVGMGFVGRGLAYQLSITPGMRPALLVNRTVERAVDAYCNLGYEPSDVLVSREPERLQQAIELGRPAASPTPEVLPHIPSVDVVVEATGAVEHGALVAKQALEANKHVISINFETDATVGALLKRIGDEHGVVYSGSDGDQPGVMVRLAEYVRGIGFEVVAAVNCKGFMDIHATPDTIREWAVRQKTSLAMTTAFTDGTKMNIENACVANATGLIPAVRGMHGVKTTLAHALEDFAETLNREGVVDYTLGGDFGGGVFVIGRGDRPDMVQHYMEYLKMGHGPWYLFYRPWHLVHLETPITVAEVVLDHQATLAPAGKPIAEVVAVAKRDLQAGERLDGLGGYTTYGEIAVAREADQLVPVGLTEHCRVVKPISRDEPIPLDTVEIDDAPLVRLRHEQDALFA